MIASFGDPVARSVDRVKRAVATRDSVRRHNAANQTHQGALFPQFPHQGGRPQSPFLAPFEGLGSRPDVRHRFVIDPASLK
jgi:hypothetical protein